MIPTILEVAGKYGGLVYVLNEATQNSLDVKDVLLGGAAFLVGVLANKYKSVRNMEEIARNASAKASVKRMPQGFLGSFAKRNLVRIHTSNTEDGDNIYEGRLANVFSHAGYASLIGYNLGLVDVLDGPAKDSNELFDRAKGSFCREIRIPLDKIVSVERF